MAAASGPELEGCGCQHAPFGCCPDNTTTARGPDFHGCGCRYTPHGCCPDGASSLPAAIFGQTIHWKETGRPFLFDRGFVGFVVGRRRVHAGGRRRSRGLRLPHVRVRLLSRPVDGGPRRQPRGLRLRKHGPRLLSRRPNARRRSPLRRLWLPGLFLSTSLIKSRAFQWKEMGKGRGNRR